MTKINAAFLRGVALVVPSCHEVTRLLSQGMDRPLPWHARLRLRLHFAGCVWCRRYARQLRQLRFFSRHFPEKVGEHDPAILPDGSRERLRAAVDRAMTSRREQDPGGAPE